MMLLPCPWCGPRNAAEFGYLGPARRRPDPATATPAQWREYLYLQPNPRGRLAETWYHRMGCRRFIRVERDTATNEVLAASPVSSAGQGS